MEFDLKKWVQVTNYLAKKEGGNIGKLKLLKLVWLADKLHLRRYGRLILDDTYFAMNLWPVASWIKDICDRKEGFLWTTAVSYLDEYISTDNDTISSANDVDSARMSETNIEVIDEIYTTFWHLSPNALVQITHKYPEWKKFEDRLRNNTISRAQMSYIDFFENIPWQDSIFDVTPEHLQCSRDIFEEEAEVSRVFA